MRDLHTTATTGNEPFPIGHGTNYFHFVLIFSLFTSKQLLFLPICQSFHEWWICSAVFPVCDVAITTACRNIRPGVFSLDSAHILEQTDSIWPHASLMQGQAQRLKQFNRLACCVPRPVSMFGLRASPLHMIVCGIVQNMWEWYKVRGRRDSKLQKHNRYEANSSLYLAVGFVWSCRRW